MKNKQKILIRIGLFTLIFAMLFCFLNTFFQPVWTSWNNYYTMHGFYEQPKNTIEVLFLGASTIISGVTPIELYKDHGICAYNMASEQQPMLASRYWAEETYRLHSDTLKTIFIDPSQLYGIPTDAFYHKALDAMKFSTVKYRAIKDYTNDEPDKTFSYLFPLTTYHDRWSSLTKRDFTKHNLEADNGTRGFCSLMTSLTDSITIDNVDIINTDPDKTAGDAALIDESAEHFEKLVAFCKQKGIKLVLIKTPASSWNSSKHNMTKQLADQYGIDFLDYNYSPLYEEIGYIHAFDSTDGTHMNYYGAAKFTKSIGEYIVENCDFTDVRNNKDYEFIKDQVKKYDVKVSQRADLNAKDKITEYLKAAAAEDNTVFITVNDEASASITNAERSVFSQLGLEKLASIKFRDSYIGIIQKGKVIYESLKPAADTDTAPLTYKGNLENGTKFSLVSGSFNHGQTSSCKIGKSERAENTRGLNIVIYSNSLESVLDSACFDTYESCTRKNNYGLKHAEILKEENAFENYDISTVEGQILRYQKKVEYEKNASALRRSIGENNLSAFISHYAKDPQKIVLISAKSDAHDIVAASDTAALSALGLDKLAHIQKGDSYIAYMNDGKIKYQMSDHGAEPIEVHEPIISLKSGGVDSGNIASVRINNIEYAAPQAGINVIIYDKATEMVADKQIFSAAQTVENK